MPRGQADFGMYAVKEKGASISDMGEVAARLGSIIIYDKRGDVVDFDNFEEPLLRWRIVNIAGTDYVRQDKHSVRSGSQAVKLHTKDAQGAMATISRGIIASTSARLGIEISFSLLSEFCYLDIAIDYYATLVHKAKVRFDRLAQELSIWNSDKAWEKVADLPPPYRLQHLYHTAKFVIDFSTDKYVRLLYDLTEYDISALSCEAEVGEAVENFIRFDFHLRNMAAVGGDVWLDDFIFTQAEP